MRTRQLITTAVLIFFGIALTGCFAKKPPPPSLLVAKFLTSSHLNPNADGAPSPVILRLYELKSAANFKSSDFFSLFDNESSVLAEELLARDELRFNPNETRTLDRELDPATRYLAVLVAFRDLDHATWRAVVKITEHETNAYTILLGRNEVSISESQPAEND
ncbi:MAG: type VI secretion system lipoprotein TssJ [Gammaproteobacteria bacterium]|nr:type VI secretion system lipoprotein TssJ [Gammaproteobacteria bacterium]